MTSIVDALKKETCASISSFTSNLGVEVTMPVVYQNGRHVSVIIDDFNGDITLHDGGFSLQSISSLGLDLKKNASQILSQYAETMGCQYQNGRILTKCSLEDMATASMFLSNVCVFASGLAVQREAEKDDFAETVRTAIRQKIASDRVVSEFEAIGASGGAYKVTAAVMNYGSDIPAVIYEAVSSPQSVNSRFRHLYDIGANDDYFATKRVSVWDDTKSFKDSDLLLLQGQSNVVPFTSLEKLLVADA